MKKKEYFLHISVHRFATDATTQKPQKPHSVANFSFFIHNFYITGNKTSDGYFIVGSKADLLLLLIRRRSIGAKKKKKKKSSNERFT